MAYLDASLVVALLVREQSSDRAEAWLRSNIDNDLAVSGWVSTEVGSALGKRVRTGSIDDAESRAAWATYQTLLAEVLSLVSVTEEAFDRATMLLRPHELGLRGGDALHLAIASLAQRSIATLDDRMAKAAIRFGIDIEIIG